MRRAPNWFDFKTGKPFGWESNGRDGELGLFKHEFITKQGEMKIAVEYARGLGVQDLRLPHELRQALPALQGLPRARRQAANLLRDREGRGPGAEGDQSQLQLDPREAHGGAPHAGDQGGDARQERQSPPLRAADTPLGHWREGAFKSEV